MTTPSVKTKRETSEKLISIFFNVSKFGFPLLGVSVIVALVVPLCVTDLPAKVLTAKLTFTSLGLLFGLLQLFLGVLLALVGVTIDYDLDATVGPAKVKLVSASPGILLILVGNLLFGFSLMREFEVSETKTIPKASASRSSDTSEVKSVDPLKGVPGPE